MFEFKLFVGLSYRMRGILHYNVSCNFFVAAHEPLG